MQLSIKKICFSFAMATLLVSAVTSVQAATTYTEDEFLNKFSGKTQKVIAEKLGAPFKKELSVKPTGASTVLGQAGVEDKGSKRVTVEMWYYKNIVRYDPKHTYKETEITFVNDKAMNIAFFNNR
ncbi:MAG: hypothetical protein WCG46_07795 [Methylophilaceae bacterium]|nr:hypothetical protein [Methylophilales bacterium]